MARMTNNKISYPEKPEFGKECNFCGFCCVASRCHLAVDIVGEGPGPCPLLVADDKDKKFYCGALSLTDDENLMDHIAFNLGIGSGCDANYPPDHKEILYKIKLLTSKGNST